jgi:amino acid transporter
MWVARLAGFASLTNLFVTYLAFFVPAVNAGVSRAVVIIGIVVLLAAINIRGLRTSATATNLLTAGKIAPLALLAIVGLAFVDSKRYVFAAAPDYAAFSSATLLIMFAFMGFEGAVIPTGEMRDPRRHLPFSLLVGMGVVAALYIGLQAVCIGTLPDLDHAARPLSDAALRIAGHPGEYAVAAGALVSIGGILNAILFATPRLIFAMAEQGELPRLLARTHPRFRTPAAAIVATSLAAGLVALFSTFLSALTLSTVVRLLAYVVTCAALPAMRWRRIAPDATFAAPAGVIVACAAIGLCTWLVSNSPLNEMRMAAACVAVGIVIYLVRA